MNTTHSIESSQSGSFNLLPADIIPSLFSLLTIKALVQMGATCREFQAISENPAYWTVFMNRISLSENPSYYSIFAKKIDLYDKEVKKEETVSRIKNLIVETQIGTPCQAMVAHTNLSQIGLSSLGKAFECAKTATKGDGSYQKLTYLVHTYLDNHDLIKAKEAMTRLPLLSKGPLIFKIVKAYLDNNNLTQALEELKHLTNQIEMAPALSLLIGKAKQLKAIDIGIKALKGRWDISIWSVCVKDFHDFLLENHYLEEAINVQVAYCKAFEFKDPQGLSYEIKYYAYTGQIEKAIQKVKLSQPSAQLLFLQEIERIMASDYFKSYNQQDVEKMASFKKELEESQSLKTLEVKGKQINEIVNPVINSHLHDQMIREQCSQYLKAWSIHKLNQQ